MFPSKFYCQMLFSALTNGLVILSAFYSYPRPNTISKINFKSVTILVQSLAFNNLVYSGFSLAYAHQTSPPGYCTNRLHSQ